MSCGVLLLTLVIVKVVSVVFVQTWFVADEYWQATEIAHAMAFRYGYETWEWREGIRGVLYPASLAALFKLLSLVGADTPVLLIHIPRLLHAIAYAAGDYHIWKLCKGLYGNASAWWTLVCLCSAWFLCYCAPRTLTSCVETVLLSVAFAHYPWRKERETASCGYLWYVGLACAIRPTAAVPFLPLTLQHLRYSSRRLRLILHYLAITTAVVVATVCVDSWYYRQLVIVPWRFVHFNVVSGLSSHYGTLPWHWYITQGLPATLTVHLLPFITALISRPSRHTHLLPVILWSLVVYSCLGHKEFRFLLPVLPLCLCVAGDHIAFLLTAQAKRSAGRHSLLRERVIILGLVIPNLITVSYLGLIHQRGPLDTMHALRNEIQVNPHANILFLMPCHSTPYFSHLHQNVTMRFLTCEPNLEGQDDYIDEADLFEKDPLTWLQQEYESQPSPTRHSFVTSQEEKGESGDDMGRLGMRIEKREEDTVDMNKDTERLEILLDKEKEDMGGLEMKGEEEDTVAISGHEDTEKHTVKTGEEKKIKEHTVEAKSNSVGELRGSIKKNALPSHIVMFSVLRDKVVDFLTSHNYHLCHHLFNSHINDGRRSQYIHIYCRLEIIGR